LNWRLATSPKSSSPVRLSRSRTCRCVSAEPRRAAAISRGCAVGAGSRGVSLGWSVWPALHRFPGRRTASSPVATARRRCGNPARRASVTPPRSALRGRRRRAGPRWPRTGGAVFGVELRVAVRGPARDWSGCGRYPRLDFFASPECRVVNGSATCDRADQDAGTRARPRPTHLSTSGALSSC
jgi:hypothetical protein